MSSERFGGMVGLTAADSRPWWPRLPIRSSGAPNVVVIVFDDVGFSDLGCYGSEINTPTLDGLAERGLRYTSFHTTALCSPTRACLLTGRNHHSVGMGGLAEWDHGYPGIRGRISRSAATLAEVLRPHGYATWAVGKWHLTPTWQTSAAGPFDQWPTQRGFDRFYGFLPGETNQYHPDLSRDNHSLPIPNQPGYHLTEDLVDRAIGYVTEHASVAPERPFFLYLCLGACHAPHHVPRAYIDRYMPVFEKGWDATRADRLARQLKMGVVPAGTELPPRNDGVRPWDDLSADEQRLAVRLQAAYAGMLQHADEHLGRLLAAIDGLGRCDDTMVAVMSDNGASQEGSRIGTVNALRYFNGERDDLGYNLAHLDEIGEAHLNNNYPLGWAMAGNTPLKRYKQNTHGGGVRDPLIISWTGGIADGGGIRRQFHHVVDIAPTVLEACGVELPDLVAGVAQMPMEGTSLVYTFDHPDVPTAKDVQHFEMLGHRGIWHNEWKAVAYHKPASSFDDDRWELYHLDEDFAECHDLAEAQPEKLAEMIGRWWAAAGRHQVLPLRDPVNLFGAHDPGRIRRRHLLYPGIGRIPTDAAPDLRNCSYQIEAEVDMPDGGAEGVLVAHGDWCGGYAFYIRDARAVYELNRLGEHHRVAAEEPLAPGPHRIRYSYKRDDYTSGTGVLSVDGKPVAEGGCPPLPAGMLGFVGLEVGRAPVPAVGEFTAPWPFTGRLLQVVVERDGDGKIDALAEFRAAVGTQ